MDRRKKLIVFIPLALAGFTLFVALGGQVVKLLWNWLTPVLFGFPAITFWQALGLLALSRLLFGGFGGGGYGRRRRKRERCEEMTPEERLRLARKVDGRWGSAPTSGSRPEGDHP